VKTEFQREAAKVLGVASFEAFTDEWGNPVMNIEGDTVVIETPFSILIAENFAKSQPSLYRSLAQEARAKDLMVEVRPFLLKRTPIKCKGV